MSLLTLNGKRLKRKYRDISKLSTVLLDDLADKRIVKKSHGRAFAERGFIEHLTGSLDMFDNRVRCEYNCFVVYDKYVRGIKYKNRCNGKETRVLNGTYSLYPRHINGRIDFKILKLNYTFDGEECQINLDDYFGEDGCDLLSGVALYIENLHIPAKYDHGCGALKVDHEEGFKQKRCICEIKLQRCGIHIDTPVFSSISYNANDVLIFSKRQQKRLEEEMVCDLCKTEIGKIIQEQCPTFETIERMALSGYTLQEIIDQRINEMENERK